MSKTALDVTTEALRMVQVLAVDETANAADHARAKNHWESIFADLDDTEGLAIEWTTETVPDRLWLHAARAVAGSIATAYGKPEYVPLYEMGMAGIRKDEFSNKPRRVTPGIYY